MAKMSDLSEPVIYQLKVVLLGISPMIWRRLLVKSDSTIEDLHYTLQIAMGWEDIHLHQFIIHGKQYGITQPGGIIFSDRASVVKLSRFGFREKEQFLYEYDFSIHPAAGAWRYWWLKKGIFGNVSIRKVRVYLLALLGSRSAHLPRKKSLSRVQW